MGWWKADPEPSKPPSSLKISPGQSETPQQAPSTLSTESLSACPVDPKTRSIWLQQAQKHQDQGEEHNQNPRSSSLPPAHPPITAASTTFAATPSEECSSDRIDQSPVLPSLPQDLSMPKTTTRPLSTDRVISSIPRAFGSTSVDGPIQANAETNATHHTSGNWIYPSESQFFHAVLRKHNPEALLPPDPVPPPALHNKKQPRPTVTPEDSLASTIPTIIPIHNAVNERAWSLIKDWESSFSPSPTPQSQAKPQSSSSRFPPPTNKNNFTTTPSCSGPKLLSFRGLGASSASMTPKARWNSLVMGYTAPFDRHDWTIQRCDGSEVEYVIDFYQGKTDPKGRSNLNFYLDVRPKINSVEGCRMRVGRLVGWG